MKKKMNPENCLEIIKAYLCVREGDGTPLDPEKMEYVPRICDGYALIYDHLYISDLQFKYIPGDKNQECRKIFFEIFENETFAFGAFKAGFLGRSFLDLSVSFIIFLNSLTLKGLGI